MLSLLSRYWWLVTLRGFLAVVFGVLALISPGITLFVLVIFFGAYVLVDGVVTTVSAVGHHDRYERWWLVLLEGLVSIAVGIMAFLWPAITAVALLYLIAAWAVVTGVFEIAAAIQLRQEIDDEWLLVLAGVASIGLGVLLFIWPGAGLLSLIWLIGIYAILFGALLIFLGFKVRGMGARPPEATSKAA